jgi:hypothetical protein
MPVVLKVAIGMFWVNGNRNRFRSEADGSRQSLIIGDYDIGFGI